MEDRKKNNGTFGRIVRRVLALPVTVILIVAAIIVFLSLTEYRPQAIEEAEIFRAAENGLSEGGTLRVMTWNIGYGALGDNADFFMDGGNMVRTADEARVRRNLKDISSAIADAEPDVLLVQEIDLDSTRSYHIDEFAELQDTLPGMDSAFARNFSVRYLPYPVPPIGKVESGVAVFSRYALSQAERVQLPIPFSWPIRMANLKRCALVTRVPLDDSGRELVLISLHLEAFDSGEGKIAQTKALAELLKEEAGKGNYVIAGGDFNQIFTSVQSAWPVAEGLWAPGEIDVSQLGSGWQCLMDDSVPSCRSLDRPYAGADRDAFQYYLIDGFIISGDLEVVSLETMDLGFTASDHNPVLLEVAVPAAQ